MTAAVVGCVCLLLVILAMLWDRREERREWTRDRADLLQRIQAPELAVVEHQTREMPIGPQPLPYDDDNAFHATREEMADALRRT